MVHFLPAVGFFRLLRRSRDDSILRLPPPCCNRCSRLVATLEMQKNPQPAGKKLRGDDPERITCIAQKFQSPQLAKQPLEKVCFLPRSEGFLDGWQWQCGRILVEHS
jgi:hypothetical protein